MLVSHRRIERQRLDFVPVHRQHFTNDRVDAEHVRPAQFQRCVRSPLICVLGFGGGGGSPPSPTSWKIDNARRRRWFYSGRLNKPFSPMS